MASWIKVTLLTAIIASVTMAGANANPIPNDVGSTLSTTITENDLDTLILRAMSSFDTPGMAVGIVRNGRTEYAKGFGQANTQTGVAVDQKSLFRIASTTKAFTTAALAILVDEGKLSWDDKVTEHLPGFRMSDPWVTQEFTIRDLLTHRSGLGLGAGDLMLWPEPSGFTRQEIVHNLRYLKPVSSFRSRYAYDNLLYIVAGEVAAIAANMTWEELVQSRIINSLGMDCFAGNVPPARWDSMAVPYALIDETLSEVTRNRIENASNVSAAAGGIVCNIEGMNTWIKTWLSGGVGPNGQRIFSEKRRDDMWTSETLLRVSKAEREIDGTHFKTYALGWRKEDMHGYELIYHTGTLSGFQAHVSLVPELGLGVVILNNGSNSGARAAIMQTILKSYMGVPERDWVQYYADAQAEWRQSKDNAAEPANDNLGGSGAVIRPLSDYAGLYEDPWFGKVDITLSGEVLRFQSRKMIKLAGSMTPFDHHTFFVSWDDKEFRAEAFMNFTADINGQITGANIRHAHPDGDWSFNFQDLNFTRVR